MRVKYSLSVFIGFLLILSLFSFLYRTRFLWKGVEGFEHDNTSIIMNKNDAFCETHSGSSGSLDESCGKLTQSNCNDTKCCVWTSANKCAAGNEKGPTFNTNASGKTKQLDYYYFQNKCYGEKCKNSKT